MKLVILLNSNEHETAWNALRLGNEALGQGNQVSMFLLGNGVEIENIRDETFNVVELLRKFKEAGGELMACGTCLRLRHQEAGLCPISTMPELVRMISEADKMVTLG